MKFDSKARSKLISELAQESQEALRITGINRVWNIAFRILLLVLGVIATGVAGYIATFTGEAEKAPTWATIANVSIPVIVALLSAFAFSEFNFSQRQATWQK